MNEDYIYSTVPDENINSNYDDKRHKVLKFLKENQGTFFKAGVIAKAVEFPTKGTQVEVRKAITELIEIDQKPIIATSKGFSYAQHPNQLKFYVNSLEERKQGLQRRIDKVLQIYDLYKDQERI